MVTNSLSPGREENTFNGDELKSARRISLNLPSANAPVNPSMTVEQQLSNALRQMIASGELANGARLPLRQLAEYFGVSTTPVRAALIELARDGLVVGRTHSGMRVAEMSLEEFEEIWTSRIAMEWWLTRCAVERVTDGNIASLQEALDGVRQSASSEDSWASYVDSSWTYRRLLFSFADRPRMLEKLDVVYARAARYSRLIFDDPARIEHAFTTMVELHEAVRKRDAKRAQKVIRSGMEWTMENALHQFTEGSEQ